MILNKFSVFLVLIFLASFASAFAGGNGTSGNPYQITTCEQLNEIRNHLTSYFILTQNVDCSATNPLVGGSIWGAQGFAPINNFNGDINGQKFAIRNLYINRPSENGVGFIGAVTSSHNPKISNVRFEDANVTGGSGVGIIAGQSYYGSIINSSAIGVVQGNGGLVGGLAGQPFNGFIDQVVFIGSVTNLSSSTTSETGGLIGRTSGTTTVGTAYTRAKIFGNGCVGGIIGDSSGGISHFQEMYAASTISGSGNGRGAVVGCIRHASDSFTNVYWDNEIETLDWKGTTLANTGNPTSVTGYNTENMKGDSVLTNFVGFDFVDVWRTVEVPSDDYPVFFWQAGNLVEVSGYVKDSFSGDIISDANIVATPDDSSFGTVITITDQNGFYSITVQSTPSYEVTVSGQVTDNSDGFNFTGGASEIINPQSNLDLNFNLGPFFLGEGTIANPYQITNVHELQTIRYFLDANYEIQNDINASETINWFDGNGFQPIGNNTNSFTGSLNGNNFLINDLRINRLDVPYIGLIGLGNNAVLRNIKLTGEIKGQYYVGGLVGRLNNPSALIENVHFDGNVIASQANTPYSDTGGIVGGLYGGAIITKSSSKGNVTGEGRNVGGLVGYLSASTVNESFSKSNVSTTNSNQGGVGGLVGGIAINATSIIQNSYAFGSATGLLNDAGSHSGIGGLIGEIRHSSTNVINSYSVGEVIQTGTSSEIGGLIGNNSDAGITQSFWDINNSKILTSNGGVGKTTTQMKLINTFTDADWNFDGIWSINPSINDGYPYLTWEFEEETFFDVNYLAGNGGSILGEAFQKIVSGKNSLEVTAIADANYLFLEWSDGNLINPRQDFNVLQNISVTAEFGLITLKNVIEDITKEGISDLVIDVNGNKLSGNNVILGINTVSFFDSNDLVGSFDHNFSESEIELDRFLIKKSINYVIFNTDGQLQGDFNKTLYLENNNFVSVCVKNEEISDISEMSSNCLGTNEYLFDTCLNDGNQSIAGINCSIDSNGIITISNLKHSAVRGNLAPQIASSGSSSCAPLYNCGEWSECTNGTQTRACELVNNCLSSFKPIEEQTCVLQESEDVVNDAETSQEETIFDDIIIDSEESSVINGQIITDINKDGEKSPTAHIIAGGAPETILVSILSLLLILGAFFAWFFVIKKKNNKD